MDTTTAVLRKLITQLESIKDNETDEAQEFEIDQVIHRMQQLVSVLES